MGTNYYVTVPPPPSEEPDLWVFLPLPWGNVRVFRDVEAAHRWSADHDGVVRPAINMQPDGPSFHLGKSFRSLQALDHWDLEDYAHLRGFGVVDSWSTWKLILRLPGVTVSDEYGHPMEVDEFIARQEKSNAAGHTVRHYESQRAYGDDRSFLDGEGYCLSSGDYS